MTVQELIDKLQDYGPQQQVHFAYDYGDRTHTLVAPKVVNVEESYVMPSDYHRMPVIADDDEDERTADADAVIVLHSSRGSLRA